MLGVELAPGISPPAQDPRFHAFERLEVPGNVAPKALPL